MNQIFNIAWLSLTYDCNNNCKWCYAASNLNCNKKEFSKELEQSFLDLFSSLGIKRLILIGGEPTLYSNLPSFIKKIREHNINPGLVSNGRRLSNPLFVDSLRKAGLDFLTISIAGYDSASHDLITGVKGSYEESIRGIIESKNKGLNVSTNTVIGTENIHNLEKIVDSIEKTGVKNMTFNACGVCLSEESNNTSILPPSIIASAFERIYFYAKERQIKTKLITPMPYCIFDSDSLIEFRKKRVVSGGPCQLVHGKNFVVEFNGDVVPCTHFNGYPLFNILQSGEIISKEEFIKEYNNQNSKDFRNLMKRYASKKCNDCNESCSGGCPLLWIKFDPEKEIPE